MPRKSKAQQLFDQLTPAAIERIWLLANGYQVPQGRPPAPPVDLGLVKRTKPGWQELTALGQRVALLCPKPDYVA